MSRLGGALLLGAVAASLAATLPACEATDADYVDQAKKAVAKGCCSVSESATCEECPLMMDAHVLSSKAEWGCANSCKMVTVNTQSGAGRAQCTYQVSKYNGVWHVNGSCAPAQ